MYRRDGRVHLQRRHFELIAATLLELRHGWLDDADHFRICEHFAAALERTNGQFDSQRFIDASRGVKAAKLAADKSESDWTHWKRQAKKLAKES